MLLESPTEYFDDVNDIVYYQIDLNITPLKQ